MVLNIESHKVTLIMKILINSYMTIICLATAITIIQLMYKYVSRYKSLFKSMNAAFFVVHVQKITRK